MIRLVLLAAILTLVLAIAAQAAALIVPWPPAESAANRILMVGPGEMYELPSLAAAAARPGDTIRILPGRYVDCAWWTRRDLVIEGTGPGVVITGKVCGYKALFVITGSNVTVRNITFTGAHVILHNGSGIRAEGANLTVENSRFIDNEEGILARDSLTGTITIRDSYFNGNGNCIAACAHGIYVGRVALLHIEHCEFIGQNVGHHIKSRALRTELIGNSIRDGETGSSSYLVDLPNGGAAMIRGNRFEKGPLSQNPAVAIAIGAEAAALENPAGPIEIEDNTLINDIGRPTTFVRNYLSTPATLERNTFTGVVTPLFGSGTVDGKAVSPN